MGVSEELKALYAEIAAITNGMCTPECGVCCTVKWCDEARRTAWAAGEELPGTWGSSLHFNGKCQAPPWTRPVCSIAQCAIKARRYHGTELPGDARYIEVRAKILAMDERFPPDFLKRFCPGRNE